MIEMHLKLKNNLIVNYQKLCDGFCILENNLFTQIDLLISQLIISANYKFNDNEIYIDESSVHLTKPNFN